jgi:uncharacterized protein YfbU (UPF0304 family)
MYCISELKKALQHDKQVIQVLLPTLQVSYPECLPEDLHEELGKKQYVDLRYEYVTEAQCYKDLSRLWGAINKWISNNRSVLSTTERWMLHNQFEILKQINSDHPDYNKNYFDHAMEILSKGYEWYYTDLSQYIYTASFPYSNGLEIINILDMFQSLQFDYEKLEDKSDINKSSLEFVGFGGNEETTEMQFTRFMMEEMGDFDNLKPEPGFNSHFPMLDTYRRMLKVWNMSVDKYRLSKEEIIRIAEARDRK